MLHTVRHAPKGLYTRAIGWGARARLPRPLRGPAYRAFARWVGADLAEVELPLAEYPSLGSFFARRLVDGARPVASAPSAVAAPCDGAVAAAGRADRGRLIQAKGRDYSLAALLVDRELAATLEGGTYVTFYLSPRDYHRVHAPVSGDVIGYDYVPGSLHPVNPLFANHVEGLFATNERVIIRLETDAGPVAVVMVAALGVGNVELAFAHSVDDLPDSSETRHLRSARERRCVRFARPLAVKQGDELAAFHLGSTVILVFPPGMATLDDHIAVGAFVRSGQPVGALGAMSSGERSASGGPS